MNWLAHVLLSEPHVEFQLGNLLTDRISTRELRGYSRHFNAGVTCHLEIDRYTDSHPVVRKSKSRIFPKYRHFSPVLIDIYYDYFLVKHWSSFANISYEQYLDTFYRSISPKNMNLTLTDEINNLLHNIVRFNVLGHYDTVDGVSKTLRRLTYRLKRPAPIDLARGVEGLIENMEELEKDFLQFYPQLQARIRSRNFYEDQR